MTNSISKPETSEKSTGRVPEASRAHPKHMLQDQAQNQAQEHSQNESHEQPLGPRIQGQMSPDATLSWIKIPETFAEQDGDAPAPRILIVYTGGTIGMIEDPLTGTLKPFDFKYFIGNIDKNEYSHYFPKMKRLGYEIEVAAIEPPIDSSNMNPARWAEIASIIAENYERFDGFVVLHGTDTMAYTASALSFMLANLKKPVILTGSQLPIGEIREDGTLNLITALQIAAARQPHSTEPMVQEVAIAFGRYLWRGNRTTKVSSTDFGAFRSFNYPSLGQMDLHITFNKKRLLRPKGNGNLQFYPQMDDAINIISIFPGISQKILEAELSVPGLKGAILRTFGAGNAPTEDWFIDTVKKAVDAGLILVNVTACPAGGVEEKRYETGDMLAQVGVLSGYDITCEAALTKLMHLFGRGLSGTEVKKYLSQSLHGEMTVLE